MNTKFLISFLAFATNSSLVMAESYVCTPDIAAGLVELDKKWQVLPYSSQSNVQKYVIKIAADSKSAAVFDQESNQKLFDCKYWFPELPVGHCGDGNTSLFKFVGDSKRSGRYSAAGIGSDYLLGNSSPTAIKNFSTVEQGKCLRVD